MNFGQLKVTVGFDEEEPALLSFVSSDKFCICDSGSDLSSLCVDTPGSCSSSPSLSSHELSLKLSSFEWQDSVSEVSPASVVCFAEAPSSWISASLPDSCNLWNVPEIRVNETS